MRVLVTGHKGFIGSVMVPMLQRRTSMSSEWTPTYRDCTFGPAPADIPEINRDIRDAQPGDVAGFDAIVHLAALSNDPLGDFDAELTYDINHRATVLLAELARTAGVPRFVFSSSCSNYGAGGDGLLEELSRGERFPQEETPEKRSE
jgi:nucleoside-diphosphate-sugar epimerase